MCKAFLSFMVLLAFCLTLAVPFPARAAPQAYEVMVVYPASPDAQLLGDLSALSELLAYMGRKTVFVRAEATEPWPAYEAAILALGNEASLSEAQARLLLQKDVLVLGNGGLSALAQAAGLAAPKPYAGNLRVRILLPGGESDDRYRNAGTVLALAGNDASGSSVRAEGVDRPLIVTAGKISHMVVFDGADPALVNALATFIQDWRWPYLDSPPLFGQYVVLGEVYPFFDPIRLMEVHELLTKLRIPYAISVMPVFQNAEFPAMQRFCEFLRYAQSQGASIVLRSPQIHITEVDPEELMRHLDIAYSAYGRYGVYPVALEAPKSWIYHETGIATLRRFRTILLFDTDEPLWTPDIFTHHIWADGHVLLAPAVGVGGRVYASTSAFASAVYLDPRQDVTTLEQSLMQVLHARVQLRSLGDIPASVYLNQHSYTTATGVAEYNGNPVSLAYEPFVYEERFAYDRGFLGFMRQQLAISNRAITLFTLVAGTLFVIFLLWGRRAIRREFLFKKGGKGE